MLRVANLIAAGDGLCDLVAELRAAAVAVSVEAKRAGLNPVPIEMVVRVLRELPTREAVEAVKVATDVVEAMARDAEAPTKFTKAQAERRAKIEQLRERLTDPDFAAKTRAEQAWDLGIGEPTLREYLRDLPR